MIALIAISYFPPWKKSTFQWDNTSTSTFGSVSIFKSPNNNNLGFNFPAFTNTSSIFTFDSPSNPSLFSTRNSTNTENGDRVEPYEPNTLFQPIVNLTSVEVKTGEEDENILFCERAKLYRFDTTSNQMKERGIGEMKILQHKTTNLCRILMRHEQVLKLCANHTITPEMELKPHQGAAATYVWTAIDFADGEAKHETFCVRLKSNELAKKFVERFNQAKQINASKSQTK